MHVWLEDLTTQFCVIIMTTFQDPLDTQCPPFCRSRIFKDIALLFSKVPDIRLKII